MRSVWRWSLDAMRWQAFTSLSFRSKGNAKRGFSLFIRNMRILAKVAGCSEETIVWFLRKEKGEAYGREHYHALIGGIPSRRWRREDGTLYDVDFFDLTGCFWFMHQWKWSVRGGLAQCRTVDAIKDTVTEYIVKCGANNYEFDKFTEEVWFSRNFVDVIAGKCVSVGTEKSEVEELTAIGGWGRQA